MKRLIKTSYKIKSHNCVYKQVMKILSQRNINFFEFKSVNKLLCLRAMVAGTLFHLVMRNDCKQLLNKNLEPTR